MIGLVGRGRELQWSCWQNLRQRRRRWLNDGRRGTSTHSGREEHSGCSTMVTGRAQRKSTTLTWLSDGETLMVAGDVSSGKWHRRHCLRLWLSTNNVRDRDGGTQPHRRRGGML
ncbi:hypothetical protein V8G54_005152, partial [Vigna mungo]